MKAFGLRITVAALVFAVPCFGWLHLSDGDGKEDLRLFLRGPTRKQIWVLNEKNEFIHMDFFLDRSLPQAPVLQADAEEFEAYLLKRWGSSSRYQNLMDHLRDEKEPWLVSGTEASDTAEEFREVRSFLHRKAIAWKQGTKNRETLDSDGEAPQATRVDLSAQQESVRRALQQGGAEIQSRALRPPYPPEPVEFAKFREGPYWGYRKKVGQIWYLLASPRFTKASDFIDGKASVEWRELVPYPKMRGYASPAERCFNWFGTLLADGSLTDTKSTVVFTNYYTQLNPVSRDCLPN